jgi:molybdopterin-guanine dinucleotide biosynthesis protein A
MVARVDSPRDTGADVASRPSTPPSPPLAGVVLCGGQSRRMGVDKATIAVGGTTLLERALVRLSEICAPVMVAPGSVLLDRWAGIAVADTVPNAGPIAGLVAALRASPHPLLAVVAVDMPWIDPDLLRLLAMRIADCDVAVCETQRGLEPLHAVYARSATAAAEAALTGTDRSLHGLVERMRSVRIPEHEWRAAGISPRFQRNVNTPEEFAELSLELRR